ncbi:MAG TPA: tRNA (guanosine(46)-N7)-methyltransferase TrmB [Chthoniobacterales bacterium]|nr:tRNA (guanosine(46)-N7)-methyltransferase TrmB [Chthoniobacterales bacterium]
MEVVPASILEPLSLREIFGTDQRVEVDLGSGPGKFLIESARRFPDRNFLGIERLLGRVRKTCRAASTIGLTNVRVLRLELDYTVRYLLPENSIWRFHLNFPDPWPKRRHYTRRIFDDEFLMAIYTCLLDHGEFWIKTDHESYFQSIAKVSARSGLWVPLEWVDEGYPPSDFEEQFLARQLPIYRLRLCKIISAPQ